VQRHEKGFTLLELLIAAVLTSLVGIVIYTTFYQGLNIWKRAVRTNPQIDFEFFFSKFEKDLHNIFFYASPAFIGKSSSIEFYSLLPSLEVSKVANGGQLIASPTNVKYSFDLEKQAIRKVERDIYQLLHAEKKRVSKEREAVSDIRNLAFQYYGYDERTRNHRWWDDWINECVPQAVKVRIEYEQGVSKSVSKIFPISVNNC
jgi:prepilin-type N-terminal cleavage/methylation domain-containing protein